MFEHLPKINSENILIQDIADEKVLINQSIMINFKQGDPHKICISNIDVDFDGLIGAGFLEHYNGVVGIKNKQLILEPFLHTKYKQKLSKNTTNFKKPTEKTN